MVRVESVKGVPEFECHEYKKKLRDYALLIPIINEGNNIRLELERAQKNHVSNVVDIVICDGDSNDGCTESELLIKHDVNTLLVKKGRGRQGAQLRMGFWWAISRGYKGIITIDGNNKDSIEDTHKIIEKLIQGYDYVQGSRFIKGGKEINTPLIRLLAVKFIHAPIVSFASGTKLTDTTNNFRGYSIEYLTDKRVDIFREVFDSYELLAYLSIRASQLKYKVCEVPVTREYPIGGRIPTKITGVKGNLQLFSILLKSAFGLYRPRKRNE